MEFLTQLIATLAVVTLTGCSVARTNKDGTFELLILHNNDMHAKFEQTSQLSGVCTEADRNAGKCYGGFARVAYLVKQARKAAQTGEGPPVLYLNAGDTYTGSPWFAQYKWKIAAEFINALQPDAVSLGNHEFDAGVSGLSPFIENLTCPVLAANLILNKVPELEREENLKKTIVLDVNGNKIGIVGYLTPTTKFEAKPNDVEYIDEIEALNSEMKNLQDQGVKIKIALGHSGFSKDMQIAKEVEGLDLVIGGHTNTFLWNGTTPDSEHADGPYPTYVQQSSGRLVPVVQAYAYTKYLGQLKINFNSDGEIVNISGAPILLNDAIPQDPEIIAIIEKYKKDVSGTSQDIMGTTLVFLDGSCRTKECNLGNLITDSMVYRYAVDYKGEHWTDAPIAILQGGGIRSSILHAVTPSNVTKGDLLSVLPFDGNMVALTMNGTVLLQILESSVRKHGTVNFRGEFLQMSGLRVTYDLKKPPGSRVIIAKSRCWTCNIPSYSKVENKQIFKVLMPGFMSNGGDDYSMVKNLPKQKLNFSELMATEYYVQRHSPIYPEIEGRIQFHEGDQTSSCGDFKLSLISLVICFTNAFIF
ncbi:ecto-nucleotidase isoform X2 [Bombyx mori]|uniref:5'-nucleotidase n=1 Tax=Bombyx mori TaxID=7091 RepID=A0A8R2M4W0_BOMMO|nr:ecto-nucleotidase isoform X5 [Bombyx mori]